MVTDRGPRAAAFLAIFSFAAFGFASDDVPIPGGPAAIRRLLALDPSLGKETFFLDVHQTLLSAASPEISWTKIPTRQLLVRFAEDLAEWRKRFGNPAKLSAVGREEWKKTKRALEWLGFKVKGEGQNFATEQRNDDDSLRRQAFLDALGAPTPSVLARLRAGEMVAISSSDETAPLPFGIAAWKETIGDPKLSPSSAFIDFVKNVRASQMLVALHALDAETREGLRSLLRDGTGRPRAWRILYDDVLNAFARFPEALSVRDARFVLPGGKEAEPVWADILGASPSDKSAFLRALYETDGGKAAYVVDVLQQLPDSVARGLLLGKTGGGKGAIKRFRRLYKSIEKEGGSYELNRRVPYDFGHLAGFLELSGEGEIWLSGLDLDETDFPRNEAELSELVARAKASARPPEETLRSLFGSETWKARAGVSPQQRFLTVSSLVAARPGLDDRGLKVLLYRGAHRFLPAYGVLEDIPVEPPLARRYLFTLDRLDGLPESQDAEVRAALFQCSVELLAQLSRTGALSGARARDLFSSLLDLPIFAAEVTTAAGGEEKLYRWLSGSLLPALRASERRRIEEARAEQLRREDAYRVALKARDERILARRREMRALDEAHLRFFLEPACPPDDEAMGPDPPRLLREWEALARRIDGPVHLWIQEAFETEQWRAAARAGRDGGLAEPMPDYVAVEIPEQSATSDELLTRALVGSPPAAVFEWRGGEYRFDAAADEIARRDAFRDKQQIASLSGVESLHARREALLAAAAKADPPAVRSAAADLFAELDLEPTGGRARKRAEDKRIERQNEQARDAAEDLSRLANPKHVSRVSERIVALDTVLAERHLEALLGHIYASSAGDPEDIYYQDPNFVRRHAFRYAIAPKHPAHSAFSETVLAPSGEGHGSRIAGSVFGLPDILGLLHSDQVPRASGAGAQNQDIRAGLMAPVRRMSIALLDDDALDFVASSCRAAEELGRSLGEEPEQERSRVWTDLARDLVPRYRLAQVAGLDGAATRELLSRYLSPSDLYRIGRRLALSETPFDVVAAPSTVRARAALSRLRKRLGEEGASERLAQFGPRAANFAGRYRLTDLELPAYERLTVYRSAQLLSDRLYDLKIAVACSVSEAGLPATVLPLVLPAALDEMIARLKMSYGSDWGASVRLAQAFTRADLDRHLDHALETGRLRRDIAADERASTE